MSVTVHNFINGQFVSTARYLDSYEPQTGKVWARIPDSDAKDIENAVQAAKAAFPSWSSQSPQFRASVLLKAADLLAERTDEFAKAESRDQGKPISLAKKVELPRACLNLRHFANAYVSRLDTSAHQTDIQVLNYTIRTAVGVAGLISPWNLPLYLLTFKLAPALMTGNTVVCKPSEMTSVTAWMLCSVLCDAGFPSGVVNMVFGLGNRAGEALVLHPEVPLISFTGSTATGSRIYSLAAHNFKKLSLELGGKNAAVIFEDADLMTCIPESVRSAFMNQGEICLATSRIFVHETIFNEFLQLYIRETKKLHVGPSLEERVTVGALISREHLAKVQGHVMQALNEGGQVHCGFTKDKLVLPEENKNGYFMLPTVITGIPDSAQCMKEEIFGPVVCIVPFQDEKEVILRVNDVKYGLCASVWTKDSSRLHRVAHQLQVGTVWSNCWLIRNLDLPFGGTKHSGIGREGTNESLEFYTEVKTVCVKL